MSNSGTSFLDTRALTQESPSMNAIARIAVRRKRVAVPKIKTAANGTAEGSMAAKVRSGRRVPLNLYVNKILDNEPHLAYATDISNTGIFLRNLLEPTAGTDSSFDIELQLPESDNVIWARCKVARQSNAGDGKGVAVLFENLHDADREEIDRYVTENDPILRVA